jgi:hypothetical protein
MTVFLQGIPFQIKENNFISMTRAALPIQRKMVAFIQGILPLINPKRHPSFHLLRNHAHFYPAKRAVKILLD